MFINYLIHELVVHELALIHELSEFKTVHEQPMFMNKVRVHEQNKFMNSWTFMKVSFVVEEYSWAVYEHVDERWWTFIVFCSQTLKWNEMKTSIAPNSSEGRAQRRNPSLSNSKEESREINHS